MRGVECFVIASAEPKTRPSDSNQSRSSSTRRKQVEVSREQFELGELCDHVRTDQETVDEAHEVRFEDRGIGMSPEELERIFDRFYQVDSGERRSFPGSGLGLYITKELVQAMAGNITVTSEPGQGSTFTFTLPLIR